MANFEINSGLHKESYDDFPLVTVIIAVFNGEKHLEKTIKSILNQTYPSIELIIIDGGSKDNTINIINKYKHEIDYFISEKDKGISDAFNKGILASTGTYINFQGDGDGFVSPNVLSEVMKDINFDKDIFISCKINRIDENDVSLYVSKYTKKFNKRSLLFRMSLPHQGLLVNKKYFKKYGLFDLDNKYCMDYEHLLRSYDSFPKVITKDLVLAYWRADGLGNGKELEIFKEYTKIKKINKVASNTTLNLIHNLMIFKYRLKRICK